VFGDYFYNVTRDPNILTLSNVALPGDEDFNGFTIRRAYFTFDDDISPDFTARFRLEANSGTTLVNNNMTVFVKDAYLRWKNAVGMSDFWFGVHPTPAYEVSEAQWRYRSLEKTIMDLRGIVPSRDLAVSLRGKIDAPGKHNYWVEVGNGSGNAPESDHFKRVYFHYQFKPNEKFMATLYQDFSFRPDIADPNDAASFLNNDARTTGWFVNYGEKDHYGVGYEGFFQHQDNGTKIGSVAPFVVDDRTLVGHSGWAWYDFKGGKVGLVGRYDYFEPNTNSAVEGDVRNLIIGGVVIRPHKNIWIMPNLYWESYQKTATGQKFDSSFTPRITFYWIFL
jgi:hypothetical protein